MVAGRVQHWKHGWIPLTPAAKAFASGLGPRPKTSHSTLRSNKVRPVAPKKTKTGVTWRSAPSSSPPRGANDHETTPAQRRAVEKVVKEFQTEFPGLEGPVPMSMITSRGMKRLIGDDAYGITAIAPDYEITLNETIWDDDKLTREMRENRDRSVVGSIAASARTPAKIRRAIIMHELSHYLHLQSVRAQESRVTGYFPGGPLTEIAEEKVTPREMGFTGGSMIDMEVPRWVSDSLDMKSAYAMGQNKYEWTAEALIDGLINGEDASDSSKRILAAAKTEFGGEVSE